MQDQEQRAAPRAPLDTYLNKIVAGVRHLVRSSNISESGIVIRRLIEPEHLGKECDLEFRLTADDTETLWARARILRDVETDLFALQFVAMSDHHRALVRRYVLLHQDWREALGEGAQPPARRSRGHSSDS